MKSFQAKPMEFVQHPENTHASLVKAMQIMDGVEFDLRLTADDQLVVHHDHTFRFQRKVGWPTKNC